MNERLLLSEIDEDLQKARFVMYVEGQTDPEVLFALLGLAPPLKSLFARKMMFGAQAW